MPPKIVYNPSPEKKSPKKKSSKKSPKKKRDLVSGLRTDSKVSARLNARIPESVPLRLKKQLLYDVYDTADKKRSGDNSVSLKQLVENFDRLKMGTADKMIEKFIKKRRSPKRKLKSKKVSPRRKFFTGNSYHTKSQSKTKNRSRSLSRSYRKRKSLLD